MSEVTNPLFGKFDEVVDALVGADPLPDEKDADRLAAGADPPTRRPADPPTRQKSPP